MLFFLGFHPIEVVLELSTHSLYYILAQKFGCLLYSNMLIPVCFHFEASFHMMVADEICVLGEHEQQLMWKGYAWAVAKLCQAVSTCLTCFLLLSN